MATWEKFVMENLIVFAFIFICYANCEHSFRELNRNIHNVVMKQNLQLFGDREFNTHVSKRSVHQIRKRAVPTDPTCQAHQATLDKLKGTADFHISSTMNDSSGSLSLVWGSSSDIIAVTTEEHFIFAAKSNTYRSTDGGKTFVNINSQLSGAQIQAAYGLQKHPNDPKMVYLLAHDTPKINNGNTLMYYSENAGSTFVQIKLPFVMSSPMIFHPNVNSKNHILVQLHDESLYLSKDYGKSWQKINNDIITAKWSPVDSVDPEGTIYCTKRVKKDEFSIASIFGLNNEDTEETASRDNDMVKTTNFGAEWTKVHLHVYSFGVQGKFLYVSVFLSAESEGKGNRVMEVSRDGGKTWNEVQLPSIEPERFYAIVEMTDDMVFIHVDEIGNSGFGTLYVSDATGILFSKSLERHLYPNYLDLTDFYRVKSMRGVYLASQMLKDQSIRSVITYNRGGKWQPIPRPQSVKCKDETKDCFLQIHNQYSSQRGLRISPPLSVESAQGLILVHGHVAEALQMTKSDVYLSSDGGYTWKKVLDGPHHYQILDQGGLIVAVPLEDYPKVIKFSVDEGNCWEEYTFTTEDLILTGLLTAPENGEMSVALWAYRKVDRKWTVQVINYEKIITQICTSSDYVKWTPHGDNGASGCLLGVKETYVKIKPDSWCRNEPGSRKLAEKNEKGQCKCGNDDYDCDYGYYRDGSSGECKINPMFKGPKIDICERGHKEDLVSVGYHKIPGDNCTGDTFHTSGHKVITLKKVCKEGDRSMLKDEIKPAYLPSEKEEKHKVRGNTAVLIAVITILILAGVLLLAFVARRAIFKVGTGYRYSQLNVNDYDQSLEAAVATHTSLYDDDSDEEAQPIRTRNTSTRVPSALQNGVLPKFDNFSPKEMKPTINFSNNKPGSTSRQFSRDAAAPSTLSAPAASVHSRPNKKVKSYHDDSDVDLLE